MEAIILAVLAGVFSTIVIGVLAYAAWRFVKAGKELIAGLKGIAEIANSNKDLVETSRMVATELQLLRSIMAANVEQAPSSGVASQFTGDAGVTPLRQRVPFPSPNYDNFATVPIPQAPDAKESDTVIVDTTDDQLVALERLEEMRQQGIEADPSELDEL